MASKNWRTQLEKHAGYVNKNINIYDKLIRMPTPSSNFVFGPPHGLVRGRSLALGGRGKAGKSYFLHAMIGQLHQDDPDAVAIKYDAEFRGEQITPEIAKIHGIDLDRLIVYETNKPDEIFDHLTHDVNALCDDGMPLALVAVDSLQMIQGIRMSGNDSILDQTIGDLAQTIPTGIKKLLPVQKRHRFSMVYISQVRAEMDPVEIRRGNRFRLALPPSVQHLIDYWLVLERNDTKDGKTDLSGNEFTTKLQDTQGNADKVANRVRIKMVESSYGIKGRIGEYTVDLWKGIVNKHEEAFLLGKNRDVIERPNNLMYSYGGESWKGQAATLEALKNNPQLCDKIVTEVFTKDINPKENDAEIVSEN